MSLFQKSVLSSYLESVSDSDIDKGWANLQSYKKMASKVQSFKEEEFQAKFLEKIFVDCFGYKSQYDSAEEGNLFFEQKNTSNSKKADGAIKKDGEVIAVIELKSSKTKNLDDVKDQAFGYYLNNSTCEYVITSNFNKLRFYIEKNEDYLEFDLFNMNKEEFKLLWLCLNSSNLLKGKPKEIKNKSIVSEEKITKKLYQDYSSFRLELFNDLVKNNPNIEKKTILNKTQKLLDRILFILFAEDRGLLPTNSISEIINFWDTKKEFGDDEYLYNTFVTYFDVINKGRQKRGKKNAIYSYNGGLFQEDDVLDNLVISDEILLKYTQKLTAYDFESEVSVDILGHIFEHSLSEIEELQNQINGVETDKSKSKRKKDGVYYTPKYITKYIVDNTLGKLCDEKKAELSIIEDEYFKGRKGRPINKLESLRDLLDEYRGWLLGLTICDPACGSGAFLNQALEFLITEHKYIDELRTNLLGGSIQFSDIENSILENNLYGVDINNESVEIAKLSLWLRTAKKERKLTSLNNNIKCGNSLIDDPEVAGDKAFNWQNEFPEVFAKDGFDVVIGNPPYVIIYDYTKEFLENSFIVFKRNNDLYSAFCQKSINLLNDNGKLGFITPNSYIKGNYFKKLRELLATYQIIKIVDFNNFLVFEDANVFSAIVILEKSEQKKSWLLYSDLNSIKGSVEPKTINFVPQNAIQNKLNKFPKFTDFFEIKDVGLNYWTLGRGKVRGESIGSRILYKGIKQNEADIPYIKGRNFNRYTGISSNNFLKHNYKQLLNENDIFRFSQEILKTNPKIIYRQTSSKLIGTVDYDGYFCDKTVHVIVNKKDYNFNLKFVLGVFNSQLLNYLYKLSTEESGRTFAQVKTLNVKALPFNEKDKSLENKISREVNSALLIGNNLAKIDFTFTELIVANFRIKALPKKLQNWYDIDFTELLEALEKVRKKEAREFKISYEKISLEEQKKLMLFFNKEKKEAQTLKTQINQTDKQIDQMVYELYGLTEKEIEIVKDSSD